LAVLLCAGVALAARFGRRGAAAQAGAFGAMLAVGLAVSGGALTPSAAHGVRLAVPGVKIEPRDLALARAVAAHAGPSDFVLAPVAPSRWLPLLHDHPHPLVVREMLLDVLDGRFDQRELTLRAQLTRMVGGDQRLPRGGRLLAGAIDAVPLQAVALQGDARGWRDVTEALEASALERVEARDDWEIWARSARP
jgi:hypothetical protein